LIAEAVKVHLEHVKAHSPDKPRTLSRYRKALEHFERILGSRRYVEVVSRAVLPPAIVGRISVKGLNKGAYRQIWLQQILGRSKSGTSALAKMS
jgi:hypothetical protein